MRNWPSSAWFEEFDASLFDAKIERDAKAGKLDKLMAEARANHEAGRRKEQPAADAVMKLTIETEQEEDGRWIAEVPELAGVLAYGATREEAMAKAQALALRVVAEQLEHGEARAVDLSMSVAAE